MRDQGFCKETGKERSKFINIHKFNIDRFRFFLHYHRLMHQMTLIFNVSRLKYLKMVVTMKVKGTFSNFH